MEQTEKKLQQGKREKARPQEDMKEKTQEK